LVVRFHTTFLHENSFNCN